MINTDYMKARRESLELSQRELASLMNTTQNQIYLWESGKRQPSLQQFRALYLALQTTPNELLK